MKRLAWGIVIALTVGCGLKVVKLGAVSRRASVDLGCPRERVAVEVIERKPVCVGSDDVCATTALAKGCGKQAVFVRTIADEVTTTWTRNSEVTAIVQ